MLPRVRRTSTAPATAASTHGRQHEMARVSSAPPPPNISSMPPTGSQANRTPNQKISKMPSQNEGVDMPTSTTTVMSLSCQAFCRTAAMMPSEDADDARQNQRRPGQQQRREQPLEHLVDAPACAGCRSGRDRREEDAEPDRHIGSAAAIETKVMSDLAMFSGVAKVPRIAFAGSPGTRKSPGRR